MNRNILSKALTVFATNWGLQFASLFSGILIARFLGAEGKGVIVLLTGGAGLLAALGLGSIHVAAVYLLRQNRFGLRALFVAASVHIAFVSIVYMLLLIVARDFFLPLFFEDVSLSRWELGIVLLLIPLTMLREFSLPLVVGCGNAKLFASASTVTTILNLSGQALAIGIGAGVGGVILALFIAQLAGCIVVIRWIYDQSRGEAWRFDRSCFAQMLSFGLRHYIGSVGSLVFKRADAFLLAYFLNVSAVGFYSISLSFYNMILTIPKSIGTLLIGEASDSNQTNSELLIARATSHIFWLMIFVSIPFGGIFSVAIPILYGAHFSASIAPLLVLLPAAVLMGYGSTLSIYLFSIDRPGTGGVITLVSGGINFFLSLLLIPRLNLVGCALATLSGTIIFALLHIIVFQWASGVTWLLSLRPQIMDWFRLLNKHIEYRLRREFKTQ